MITFFGTILTLSSTHWLMMWMGLEINLLGFIPLLMFQSSSSETEAGVKYFIFQAIGSSMIMTGSMMSFNLTMTWESLSQNPLMFLLIIMGLMIKLGSFPFHFWVPSVMASLSWFSCMMISTWQKLGPLFILCSLIQYHNNMKIYILLFILASLSSLIGGIGGINQSQLRAIMAYSSIGHMGWMIFALIHNSSLMTIYFLIYVLITLTLFLIMWTLNMSSMNYSIFMSWKSNKSLKFLILTFLLSLGGLPPLLGFISKASVIFYSSKLSNPFLIIPLIIGSLLSLFYYLTLMFSMLLISSSKTTSLSLSYPTIYTYTSPLSTTYILIFSVLVNTLGSLIIILIFPLMNLM
uniref:NADH-ubiquinone oxidoreductase chain 2 n=1 Tax=Pseudococculinidae sp. MNHN-IM-2013-40847 TaxID=2496598 RepID=A0A6B7FM45_9VEST|nr:NADH dehydrogenase subunit 2 [Pseudococculinidae sp. MNHN-IM-2013-40847]